MARLTGRRRILVWGEMGTGKSTLAFELVRRLHRRSGGGQLLSLDPGTPPFGIPGALTRGWFHGEAFAWGDPQALCTLDAARFRLPLVLAARRLCGIAGKADPAGLLVVDPPGVVRGAGGAELLTALAEALEIDAVVALHRREASPPLARELSTIPAAVHHVSAAPEARRPGRGDRADHRTRLWDAFLSRAAIETLRIDRVPVLGTPPPRQTPEAWAGRQAALLDAAGATLQMGEVVRLAGRLLTVQTPPGQTAAPAALLIRNAGRSAAGRLETCRPAHPPGPARGVPVEMTAPPVSPSAWSAPVSSRVGPAWATLVGGVFGDPLLHVRLRRRKRSLLFDLGDPGRLPAKVAHQVSDVFLSHAHLDHVGGFIWFLRSRIGPFGPCRIFGPPETIARIAHFLDAITWDRIKGRGPVFEVGEIDGGRIRRAKLQPGRPRIDLPPLPAEAGVILDGEDFRIFAAVCDHRIPSVAYALAFHHEIIVRREKLLAAGWPPGPWVGKMKHCIHTGNPGAEILLPDGSTRRAGDLADALTMRRPGKKLVYAADMADTPDNRQKLIHLARSAHILFCEAAFTAADRSKAAATQHLTTVAAAEIAREAGAARLVPFHFSKRYEHDPGAVYDEIAAAAGPVRVLGGAR